MKRIRLTQNKYAIVDSKDFNWLNQWKWCYKKSKVFKNGKEYGVAVTGIWNTKRKNNDIVRMHRLILNCPKGKMTDHINGNQLDNRRKNLRIVDGTLNNMNRQNVKGCYWDKQTNQWKVELGYYGKRIWLGRFNEEKEAIRVYQQAVLKYYGQY